MKDSQTTTANSVAKILFWMLIFLLLYIPLLALVIASLGACICGIVWSIYLMTEEEGALGIFILLIISAIIILLIFPILKATFRPFFTLYKNEHDERIEVTESDAPELVKFVNDLAKKTKNKRPKHIYVSAEANACVFFNSRFINIFFPVRKNIEIGLSLFHGLTKGEIAACIGHEFGHFSQGNMRWGTIVHTLNSLIKNVMGINKQWNSVVNNLINFPWIIGIGIVLSIVVKIVGWILYGLTVGYMSLMDFLYSKIQMSYLELSRKMEFEADLVAAKIAGSKNVISFMYKLIELSDRVDVHQRLLERLANQNKKVANYWQSYLMTNSYLSNLTQKELSSSEIISNPLSIVTDKKLIVDNIYSTHPDWQSRINAIKETDFPTQIDFTGEAVSLISTNLWDKVSQLALNDIYEKMGLNNKLTTIKEHELEHYIAHDLYWFEYTPFFNRDVLEFNIKDCQPDSKAFFPKDNDALMTISSFEAAKADWTNANAFINNKLKTKYVIYNETKYSKKNIPLDEIEMNYKKWLQKAKSIDQRICQKALAGTVNIEQLTSTYANIFYSQKILDEISTKITPNLNKVIGVLNKSASNTNRHQFNHIQNSLETFRCELYEFAYNKMDLQLFKAFAPRDAIDCLRKFRSHKGMFVGNSISGDSINLLIVTCHWIKDIHEDIMSQSKMQVIDACLSNDHTINQAESNTPMSHFSTSTI